MMRDELYDEFEEFYGDKFNRAIDDAIDPDNKELHKFIYTDFYQELLKKDKE